MNDTYFLDTKIVYIHMLIPCIHPKYFYSFWDTITPQKITLLYYVTQFYKLLTRQWQPHHTTSLGSLGFV